MTRQNILLSVVGPTAVGKTRFGIELAKYFRTEVLSVDSRQFYREMEIGTAKPSREERAEVKHHFVDSHSIHDDYNVGKFEQESLVLLDELFLKYDVVVAVGGSGLFFKGLWDGFDEMPKIETGVREQLNGEYESSGLEPLLSELRQSDPIYYEQVDRNNWQRIIRALEVIRSTGQAFSSFRVKNKSHDRNFQNIKIGLEMDREILFNRIDNRMDQMIQEGLFAEAEALKPFQKSNALQTVGYSEIFRYLDGEYDKQEAIRLLKRNSRRYAKRQMTWFKKDPEIQWFNPNELGKTIEKINQKLK